MNISHPGMNRIDGFDDRTITIGTHPINNTNNHILVDLYRALAAQLERITGIEHDAYTDFGEDTGCRFGNFIWIRTKIPPHRKEVKRTISDTGVVAEYGPIDKTT